MRISGAALTTTSSTDQALVNGLDEVEVERFGRIESQGREHDGAESERDGDRQQRGQQRHQRRTLAAPFQPEDHASAPSSAPRPAFSWVPAISKPIRSGLSSPAG